MKTENSDKHHPKCPYKTFFFIPTPTICLFTKWHIDQQNKYIIALQELLKKKKNQFCYIDRGNEDECGIRAV